MLVNCCTISDIDECESENIMSMCNGTCENTPGSYNCFCSFGYTLDLRENVCVGKGSLTLWTIIYGILV